MSALALIVVTHSTAPTARAQSLDEARQLVADGNPAQAAAVFRQVAETTDDPTLEATARNNACVLFNNVGDATAALPECQRALELRRGVDDDRRLARTLNNLALVQQSLGNFEAAATSFEEALAVNHRRGDAAAETLVRSNLGWLWTSAGRYSEAIHQLAEALRLAEDHAETPWAGQQRMVVRLNYGVLLEKLGAYREALELYEDLLSDPIGLDEGHRATIELDRGVMYRNLGDPIEALGAFEKAARAFETLGDRASLSNAWLNIGLARHLNLGQLEAAGQAFDRALAEARQSGDVAEVIQDLIHLGRLRLDQGQLDAAERAFEEGLALAKTSGSTEGRWATLEGRGRVLETRGDLVGARTDLEHALDIIEGIRADLDEHRWRVGYFGEKRAVYSAMVRVLAELAAQHPTGSEAERAWAWVQKAKARELLDAVGGGAAPLSPADLGPLLGPHPERSTLLELFVGERRLFAWVATAESGLRMVDLGSAAPVIEHTHRLHQALASGDPLPAESLASLSATLLAATDVLGDQPDHLWITADGPLRRLPFEVLDIGGNKLIDQVAVSYLPNTSALASIRQRQAHPSRGSAPDLAALGDPFLATSDPTDDRRFDLPTPGEILVRRFALPDLPGAGRELAAVAGVFRRSSELRLGADATEAAFRQLAAQDGAVLHLATHTLLDDSPGGGAAILLTPSGDDDGLLWARELSQLSVGRRLTVLAACRSALAPSQDTDALASLTGALLAAGSSAVVASLWDVDDAATAVFMEQLYYQLGRGFWPAEALRQAKLRLRSDPRWDQPTLWAAFVLVGDTPPLTPPHHPWRRWALGLLVVATTWLVARWRFRR